MYTKNLSLRILDTGPATAVENMSLDAKLLAELDPQGSPLLHLYDWMRPSITYGHFIDSQKLLNGDALARHKIDVARRPTGGGIVFHIWDFAFSFLMPAAHPLCSSNTLDNYRFVNEFVLEAAIEHFGLDQAPLLIAEAAPLHGPACAHFCMARPTVYDVVYQGRKIAGAAQRRTQRGYLHQGTISLAAPNYDLLREVLRSDAAVVEAMGTFSFVPAQPMPLPQSRAQIAALLQTKFLAKIR